jgi:glutaredoxin/glutathione-dependent peroxiredoxin
MTMPIQTGDRFPEATFTQMTEKGPAPVSASELFKGKKVVLFAVPGAFTPTCSKQHLPGYIKEADAMKAMGVDLIACMAVNDAFVMDAWGQAQGAAGKVLMLADGNGDVTRTLGLESDFSKYGMGQRSRRFSMILQDGVVKQLNVEAPGEFKVSSAEATVCQL